LSPLSASIADPASLREHLQEAQEQLQMQLFSDEREKAEQARKLRELLGVDTPSHRSPAKKVNRRKLRKRQAPPEDEFDSDSTIITDTPCPSLCAC
jgi:hypothetical protein